MKRSPALLRLQKALRRHLAQGWQRAVFAAPQSSSDGEPLAPWVIEGPQPGLTPEAALAHLLARAEEAIASGRIKHTYVIDETRKLRVDARHGHAKLQRLDEETLGKMMGGKDRPLRPDASADLLRHIGIMNPDGSISAKNAKKYKQINHFVELCRPVWTRLCGLRTVDEQRPLRVFDLGCGNSYLSFVLAEALRLQGVPLRLIGIDRRGDVVQRSLERANALGWSWMTFRAEAIETTDLCELGGPPDLVMSLHACDTATDDALARAIESDASAIFAAPCCQHELATQLDRAPVPALVDHGLFKQDYAALLTDALRAELLEAAGYRVDLLEFVASEHSMKNRLLRANRQGSVASELKLSAVAERCRALGVLPKLLTHRVEAARMRPPQGG